MTDYLFDESSRERLIEDYLFSGYKPASKSTFDLDQQFARPIEDEDIFGCSEAQSNLHEPLEQNNCNEQLNFDDKSFGGDDQLVDHHDSPSANLFDETSIRFSSPNRDQQHVQASEIDEIFLDDFSSASYPHRSEQNDENLRPSFGKSYTKNKPPPQPSPADVRKARLRASLLEQVKARDLQPRTIGTGFSESGEVEIALEQHKLVSDTNSKFIFNKLFNNSKKAQDGTPERSKKSWDSYSESLRKRICTQKRKIWDTFQQPTDGYDDEEELIELPDDNAEDVTVREAKEDSTKEDAPPIGADGEDPHELDKEELESDRENGSEVSDDEDDEEELGFEEEVPEEVDEEVGGEDLYNNDDSESLGFDSDSESEGQSDQVVKENSIESQPKGKIDEPTGLIETLLSDDSEDVVKRR